MKKLLVLIAFGTLAGCNLYFGPGNDTPGGTGGGGGGGGGSGYQCTMSTDCAAGCYCASGTCEEGGFCTTDTDCGPGFHCNTDRSSCEPNPPCTCSTDQEAIQKGFGWCDETTMTCQTGTDPAGGCVGAVTCSTAAPKCAEHEVPLIKDGCYTGSCRALSACEGAPACGSLQHEDDCLASSATCGASYTGINCHKADGSACHQGDTGCTCDNFVFANCVDKMAGARVTSDSAGAWIDISQFFQQ